MNLTSYRNLPNQISDEVLDLLCKSFPGDIEYLKLKFLNKFNSREEQSWHIACEKNVIHGVLNICYRTMNFKGFDLSVCGVSHMAISKNQQNKGLSKMFQDIVIKESNLKDVSLGFARKKMDGYWVPLGFVGITDFAEFTIFTKDIILFDEKNSIKFINYDNKFFDELKRLSVINNDLIVGNLKRELWHWEEIIKDKIYDHDFKLLICYENVIGYLIFKDNIIIEIFCEEKYIYEISYALKKFFRNRNIEKLIFKINLNNPLLLFLSNFNHTINKRFAFDGGHILRVNNYEKILAIIGSEFFNKLLDINYSIPNLKINKKHFLFDNKSKKFIIKNNEFESLNEKTKFLFGLQKSNDKLYSLIFPNQYIQFSLLDGF